ncbi:MAG: hypothetical protein KC646_10355 [Candidatus Cloacimonetes bacterium]|nr:hypothetical protein [Candidatus Cloacimonadota bacterium]
MSNNSLTTKEGKKLMMELVSIYFVEDGPFFENAKTTIRRSPSPPMRWLAAEFDKRGIKVLEKDQDLAKLLYFNFG